MKEFFKMKNKLKLFEAMRSIAIIALVAIIGFSMIACSDDDGGIVGRWTSEGVSFYFYSDGSGYYGSDSNGFTWTQSGSYIFVIFTSSDSEPELFTYSGGNSFKFNDRTFTKDGWW